MWSAICEKIIRKQSSGKSDNITFPSPCLWKRERGEKEYLSASKLLQIVKGTILKEAKKNKNKKKRNKRKAKEKIIGRNRNHAEHS